MSLCTLSLAIDACSLFSGDDDRQLHTLTDSLSGERLLALLHDLASLLDAAVVAQSSIDYEPAGASANLLVGQSGVGLLHLDKSHIAAHTYVDEAADGKSSFRLGLDIGTCGELPLARVCSRVAQAFSAQVLVFTLRGGGIRRGEDGRSGWYRPLFSPPVLEGYECVAWQANDDGARGLIMGKACPPDLREDWQAMFPDAQIQ